MKAKATPGELRPERVHPNAVAKEYFAAVRRILDQAEQTQQEALFQAAQVTAVCLMNGGMLHVFGTGHSHILAEEIFFRAGGLVQIDAVLDPGLMLHLSALGSTALERLPGYAEIVLQRYDLRAGDILLVVSNSGRNSVPIEAAAYAKKQALTVIAMTSAGAYQGLASRHPSGKRLADLADVVIDTCVPEGDAALSLPGLPERIGPTSTIIGTALIQAYICETVQQMLAQGCKPKVLVSANVDGGQDHQALFAEFSGRIRHS
jgi:uncharacterized phosphosugar-binding protein